MFKKIMVATDGSSASIKAGELAVDLASRTGGGITAIYVVDIYRLAHLPGYIAFPSLGERLMELMLKEGELATSEICELASEAKVPFVRIIAEGHPSEEILKRSQESGTDLLVIGSIGRSGLEKIVLGSVAEKVLRHSTVPVLIVPAR